MPGLCAVLDIDSVGEHQMLLQAMTSRLTHDPSYECSSYVDKSTPLALGCTRLPGREESLARSADGELVAVLDGEIYDADEQRIRLRSAGSHESMPTAADVLLQGYQQDGRDFFAGLHGKFVAAIWDCRHRTLVIANDRFGMKPCYWSHLPGGIIAAAEIKGLLTHPNVSRSRDEQGLIDFLTYGHLLGNRTLLAGAQALPAASWLTYHNDSNHVILESYLPPAPLSVPADQSTWLDQVTSAFEAAIERSVRSTGRLGLSLSGGLDARTILGVINHERTNIRTVSMGMAGSLDHRSAAALARLSNGDHHEYLLDEAFLADFPRHMRHMVHLTDGHYLDQCIVLPTLPYYQQLGIQVLIRGHAGELTHLEKAYNFSHDAEALGLDNNSLFPWLQRRLCAYMLDGLESPMLSFADQADMRASARDSLQACLAEISHVERPVQRISHLFLSQRMRRETAMSLAMFGSVVETRVPYLDNELVDLLLAAPAEFKMGDQVQTHILKRFRPEFLRITNANTGTRMGVSRLRQKFSYSRMRALAKLGVPGYQPYERLGLWLRRELRPFVEEVLLSDRCLERGVFVPDTVRTVVSNHLANRRNHTFLLMALMIYELGQREFIDSEGNAESEPAPPVASLTVEHGG